MWQPVNPDLDLKPEKHRKVFNHAFDRQLHIDKPRLSQRKKAFFKELRSLRAGEVMFVHEGLFSIKTVRQYVGDFKKENPSYVITTHKCKNGVEIYHRAL